MKNVWPSAPLRLCLIGVLPACLVGAAIMRLHDAPWSMPLTNFVALLVGIVAILALAMLPGAAMAQVLQFRTNRLVRACGASLAAYFAANIVVVAVGEFPTPVLGFGASPILGATMGLGLLGQIANREAPTRG